MRVQMETVFPEAKKHGTHRIDSTRLRQQENPGTENSQKSTLAYLSLNYRSGFRPNVENGLVVVSFSVTTKGRIEQSRVPVDLVIVLGFAKQSGRKHPEMLRSPIFYWSETRDDGHPHPYA
jgi:hypothetical protein